MKWAKFLSDHLQVYTAGIKRNNSNKTIKVYRVMKGVMFISISLPCTL